MMNAGSARTIAVVTGTRAEFGLLRPVMEAIRAHPMLALRTIVTGRHWVAGTWRDVEAAGFAIDAELRMQTGEASGRAAEVQALGRGVMGFGELFAQLRPDVVLVLGDRIEVMAAATAASVGGQYVGHIHGGDRAEGVADEAMRHAVSKLAHLHFAATEASRERLVRMGESTEHVFVVGSPAMDCLSKLEVAPAEGNDAPLLVMQHPVGEAEEVERRWMAQTLEAVLDWRAKRGGRRAVFVLDPNGDPGSEGVCAAIEAVLTDQPAEVIRIAHLPRERFLQRLASAGAIVGNSSAGLIEAAALRVPCINIGSRQAGRERTSNVIDCDHAAESVQRALDRAMAMDRKAIAHPYGDGQTGQRMARLLAEINLDDVPLRKRNAY